MEKTSQQKTKKRKKKKVNIVPKKVYYLFLTTNQKLEFGNLNDARKEAREYFRANLFSKLQNKKGITLPI